MTNIRKRLRGLHVRKFLVPAGTVLLCIALGVGLMYNGRANTGVSLDTSGSLLHVNFENSATGSYSATRLDGEWNNANGTIAWSNNPGRYLDIIKDGSNTVLRKRYPKDTCCNSAHGTSWRWKLNNRRDELYMAYRVKTSPNFNGVKGGKLPGMCGGECKTGGNKPTGSDGWSARNMWRSGNALVQYLYYPDQAGNYGADLYYKSGTSNVPITSDWQYVEHRVKMNTPGSRNGIMQAWVDGELVLDRRDIRFRDIDSFSADSLLFSTFFGGNDSTWAPTKDEYVYFDDFVVSTKRITGTPTPAPGPVAIPFRMNVGGAAYSDPSGATWQADAYASGGATLTRTTPDIIGTTKDSLYQSERYGSHSYSIPIPNGTYRVVLHHAETFSGCAGVVGCRIFSASAEGQAVYTNLDLATVAAGYTAVAREQTVSVTDGTLNIQLSNGSANNAQINAIEILPGVISTPTPSPTPTPTPAPTPPAAIPVAVPFRLNTAGPAYTDPEGTLWQADAYASGGATLTRTTPDIIGTTKDSLYQSERYGTHSYNIPVTNGTYRVILHHAETFPACAGVVGCRIFSASAEGQAVYTNLDLASVAAGYTAVIREQTVTVSDGSLTINLTNGSANNAQINAIEVLAVASVRPGDANRDNHINLLDFNLVLAHWGRTDRPAGDLNRDGQVNVQDLNLVIGNWGA